MLVALNRTLGGVNPRLIDTIPVDTVGGLIFCVPDVPLGDPLNDLAKWTFPLYKFIAVLPDRNICQTSGTLEEAVSWLIKTAQDKSY